MSHDIQVLLEKTDFTVIFDRQRWTAEWKWQSGEPEVNNRAQYGALPQHLDDYEAKLDWWRVDGWLEPHDPEAHDDVDGLIPLMTANQPSKLKKVCSVMDYGCVSAEIVGTEKHISLDLCEPGPATFPDRKVQRSTLCYWLE